MIIVLTYFKDYYKHIKRNMESAMGTTTYKCDKCIRNIASLETKVHYMDDSFVSKVSYYCLACAVTMDYSEYTLVDEFLPEILLCKKDRVNVAKELHKNMQPIQKTFAPILMEYLLLEKRVKYNKDELVLVAESKVNGLVWLEYGSEKHSGLNHITSKYSREFEAIGIKGPEAIVKALQMCLSTNPVKTKDKALVFNIGLPKLINIHITDSGSISCAYPGIDVRPRREYVLKSK
jgi:hypothetical protein